MDNEFDFTDIINNIDTIKSIKYNKCQNKELLSKPKQPRGRQKGKRIPKHYYIREDGLVVKDGREYCRKHNMPLNSLSNCANPKSGQKKDAQRTYVVLYRRRKRRRKVELSTFLFLLYIIKVVDTSLHCLFTTNFIAKV